MEGKVGEGNEGGKGERVDSKGREGGGGRRGTGAGGEASAVRQLLFRVCHTHRSEIRCHTSSLREVYPLHLFYPCLGWRWEAQITPKHADELTDKRTRKLSCFKGGDVYVMRQGLRACKKPLLPSLTASSSISPSLFFTSPF